MKVVICGQRRFGLEVLKLCEAKGLHVVAVIVPDSDTLLLPYAVEKKHPVFSPQLFTFRYLQRIVEFDLGITAHFFDKINKDKIEAAKIGWLGYHPSLLPRHRGRSSIEWAMREKDPITGGTLYWLNDKWDEGDIAYQDWIFLDHDKTIKEVWDQELMPMGVRLFKMAFEDLLKGIAVPRRPAARR